MKYEIEVNGHAYTVELELENNRGIAWINGHSTEFDVSQPEPDVYTLLLGSRVSEVRIVTNPPDVPVEAITREHKIQLQVLEPRQRRRRRAAGITGKIELKAIMPGRVLSWLCQQGDEISEGQGVVVVEAMKMQNDVRSPKDGRVAELRVKPGSTVNAGDVLAVIE